MSNLDPTLLECISALHEVKLLARIHAASAQPKNWRVAAWQLERLDPDRYGPQPNSFETADEMEFGIDDLLCDYLYGELSSDQYDRILAPEH